MRRYVVTVTLVNGTSFGGLVESIDPAGAQAIASRIGREGYTSNGSPDRAEYFAPSTIKSVRVEVEEQDDARA